MLNMTPKRAATLLAYNWITGMGPNPYYMDAAQMSEVLEDDYNWKVTEKRRDATLVQLSKIMTPLENRLQDALEKAGIHTV